MLQLEKFSLGVGDRFGRQAEAQLRACLLAAEQGVEVIPVWNKSHREHIIIGSSPQSTRAAADNAVAALNWKRSYYVDADHIELKTVDRFLPYSDFFTMDVAEWIGRTAPSDALNDFAALHPELLRGPFEISPDDLSRAASKYLLAVRQAGEIYRHIEKAKGAGNFIAEISMDETDEPQTPAELLIILAAIADEQIPIQTIAPKFIGRFNKGVDYVGDLAQFEQQFNDYLGVISHAVKNYQLPSNLKLSVHSGSDKFSLYPIIRRSLSRFGAGLHLKTAGTTWLEELAGLAQCGGDALIMAKKIYAGSLEHFDELCRPYATVIAIDRSRLPSASEVSTWTAEQFTAALRHDPDLRQLLHVGYKIAAQQGPQYLSLLDTHRSAISPLVTANLFQRHIKPIFIDQL
jgi:hypothetical protein